MALRIRRGTDTQRQNLTGSNTPVDGELIWTTDTKQLYVGDGTTTGGILVTGAGGGGSTTLEALTDTDLTGASNNDVLTYNSGTNKWEPVAVPGIGTLALGDLSNVFTDGLVNGDILQFDGLNFVPRTLELDDLSNINTTGVVAGDLLQFDGTNFVPKTIDEVLLTDGTLTGSFSGTFDGDVTGSVFGDDSSVMVDGVNQSFHTGSLNIQFDNIESTTGEIVLSADGALLDILRIDGAVITIRKPNVDGSNVNMGQYSIDSSRGSLAAPLDLISGDFIGSYNFNSYITGVGFFPTALIVGQVDTATVSNDAPGKIFFALSGAEGGYSQGVSINSRSHIEAPVMKFTPYADVTARDTALPGGVVEAGMTIYLASTNKLQVNTDSTITGWIDLN